MENLFIPYELAVKLKEKEFEQDCLAHYTLFGKQLNIQKTGSTYKGVVLAPLYQQVVDWFREEHGISIELFKIVINEGWNFRLYALNNNGAKTMAARIKKVCIDKTETGYDPNKIYDTYYKALSNAIEETLKLI